MQRRTSSAGDQRPQSCALDDWKEREPIQGIWGSRFFGAHLRVEQDAEGGERLVGFNASEEPTSALLNFFEYDSGFRLLHKVTHRLQVQMVAHRVCLLPSLLAPGLVWRLMLFGKNMGILLALCLRKLCCTHFTNVCKQNFCFITESGSLL